MKQLISISVLFLVTVFSYGQSSIANQLKAPGIYLQNGSKLDEYKKTYEIKHVPNPDQSTLSKIDMSKYWKLIQANQRVEVVDGETGLTLILYSRAESNAIIDFNSVLIVLPPEPIGDEIKKTQ